MNKKRRLSYLAALAGLMLSLGLCFVDSKQSPPEPGAENGRLVYLCWTDERVLEQLAREFQKGDTELVVGQESLAFCKSYCAKKWKGAKVVKIEKEDEDDLGVTLENVLEELTNRSAALSDQAVVYISTPRCKEELNAKTKWNQLIRSTPWLVERVKLLNVDHFGLNWPTVNIDVPLTVSPDQENCLVSLIARDLPNSSCECEFQLLGPRKGVAFVSDSQLTKNDISVFGGGLSLNGSTITSVSDSFEKRGNLPAPREGFTLTYQAKVINEFGESIAWAQATTTSQIQPIGILVPKSNPSQSALQIFLQDLGLEHQDLVVDLASTSDPEIIAQQLARWRVLLLDHSLGMPEAKKLQDALRLMSNKPVILFVGSGSDQGILPSGWHTLMKDPVKPSACRKIVIGSDTSVSMEWKISDANSSPKLTLSTAIAKTLVDGLRNRNWNGLVTPLVGPNGGEGASVENYALRKIYPDWELDVMLKSTLAKVKAGEAISDCIFIFDPDDVDTGGVSPKLPADAQNAANELSMLGVRLWLIATGNAPSEGNLGSIAYKSTIASLSGCGNNANQFLAKVNDTLLTQMFPRLSISVASANGLTAQGHKKLADFVNSHSSHLKLLNGLVQFDKTAGHPEKRVSVWIKHWNSSTDLVSPLLLSGEMDLGNGSKGRYMHLALDLTAERAKIPAITSQVRSSLSGLIVRIISALSDELQEPGIYWVPNGQGGLAFYTTEYGPFQINPGASDPVTLKGVGLGLHNVDGFGKGYAESKPDVRRLEFPSLTPKNLHPTEPSAVRFVVEDQRSEVGKLALTVSLLSPPIRPTEPSWIAAGEANKDVAKPIPSTSLDFSIPEGMFPLLLALTCMLFTFCIATKL